MPCTKNMCGLKKSTYDNNDNSGCGGGFGGRAGAAGGGAAVQAPGAGAGGAGERVGQNLILMPGDIYVMRIDGLVVHVVFVLGVDGGGVYCIFFTWFLVMLKIF